MNDDLRLALQLADEADAITMKFFRAASLSVKTKVDRTPVTEADLAVEKLLRERLADARPDDAIVGEEFGVTGSSPRRWILDPIDATKNFMRGIPVFATLIALRNDEGSGRLVRSERTGRPLPSGESEIGVVSAPALGMRWWASRGAGAFRNGEAIHVSEIATIEEAQFTFDDIITFERLGLGEQFLAFDRRCGRTRGFGDFWGHMLVAEGACDVTIEPEVSLWDMAPLQVIVEEAGGRFTNLAGEARSDGGSGVSTNGVLHEAVLASFRPSPPPRGGEGGRRPDEGESS